MSRFVYRRLISLVVLLCQLTTATLVQVPMPAFGMGVADISTTSPCHEHSARKFAIEAVTAAANAHALHTSHSEQGKHDGSHCGAGPCHCTCAHPPVVSNILAPRALVSTQMLSQAYSVPPARIRPVVLFRPPI
jgi:hypothetical protein